MNSQLWHEGTRAPALGSRSLSLWATREVPNSCSASLGWVPQPRNACSDQGSFLSLMSVGEGRWPGVGSTKHELCAQSGWHVWGDVGPGPSQQQWVLEGGPWFSREQGCGGLGDSAESSGHASASTPIPLGLTVSSG